MLDMQPAFIRRLDTEGVVRFVHLRQEDLLVGVRQLMDARH